jgi:cytoskeletal protein RodZ
MHDDPTRMMGQPEQPRQPRGNVRLLVAGLIAVIVGLVVAIVVIASDSGSGGPASTQSAVFTENEPTESTTESTGGTTTEPTSTEPTTETTTEPTIAPPTTSEEENGSGGIPAE